MCTTKSTIFAVSKDEWDTKEGTGKSMSTFYKSSASKGTSWAEVTSSSEKIKSISFAIVELHWSGRQAGRQTGRQAGRKAGRQAGRQEGRQAGRKAGRKAGRQALLQ